MGVTDPKLVQEEANRSIEHKKESEVKAAAPGTSIQPLEQARQNQCKEEFQQAEIETWTVRILHRPPPVGRDSRMVVGQSTTRPPQNPGKGENKGNQIQISPDLGGIQSGTPHQPQSGKNPSCNPTHRGQSFPQSNQDQGILENIPGVGEGHGNQMGAQQTTGDHPEDKPGGRLPVQSSSLGPPHQHPATQQDGGCNQYPEGVQGDGAQLDGWQLEVGEHEGPSGNGP